MITLITLITMISSITSITMITKDWETGMYIMTFLSDRIRPSWSTHIATCHIDIASNTGLFLLLYCSPPCFLSSR
ncbi:hypothetical protein M432DRAFT_419256 [Thermoascus aurantiacus ATCC 26904]